MSRARGFAALKERGDGLAVSEIARKGGRAAHEAGTAHEFSSEEAREAGRKGGRASAAKKAAAKREARARAEAAAAGEGGSETP